MIRTLMGPRSVRARALNSGAAVVWWWVLSGVEVGWVLGVWLLLRNTDSPRVGGEAAAVWGVAAEWYRGTFVWGYFLYHLPLLLVDYLTAGWGGRMLKGRGAWLVAQAMVIGAATVAAYGTVLTWFLG
jgi:hypothetical protein